jgi:hypothetical protein
LTRNTNAVFPGAEFLNLLKPKLGGTLPSCRAATLSNLNKKKLINIGFTFPIFMTIPLINQVRFCGAAVRDLGIEQRIGLYPGSVLALQLCAEMGRVADAIPHRD